MIFNRLKPKHYGLVGLFLYWLIVNVVILHPPFSVFPTPAVAPLLTAEYLASDVDHPALLPETGWQKTQLPDDWYQSDKSQQQYWYRLIFSPATTIDKVWKVYLPSVSHNAEVYVNGLWVGRGGRFSNPVSRHHNEPLRFEFDASVVASVQHNVVDIRVKASYHEQGYLGPVYIAPAAAIENAYFWKNIIRVELVYWVVVGMLFLSFVLFLFWLARKQDVLYLIFALQLLIWSIHNLNLLVSNIPTSALFWEAMTMVTLGWTVVLMLLFNHRFLDAGVRWVEKAAIGLAMAGSSIFFLPDIGQVLTWGYLVWDSLLIMLGTYSIGFLLYHYCKTDSKDALLMIIVGIPILASGFHDILLVNHMRDRAEGLIIQYSAIPAIILFTWFLLRHFVSSLNTAEQLTETLEKRVEEKESDLIEKYEQIKILEQEKLLSQERERIMRDMHDGIGGQLIGVLNTVANEKGSLFEKIKEKVQLSMTDLRLVIDSLDPTLKDISTLLGVLRYRIEHQLTSANIRLLWDINELPDNLDLSPQKNLHIMRIMQEAVNNSIKHSETGRVSITTEQGGVDQQFCIKIIDYGKGFNTTHHSLHGRGITNMQYRAQQAEIELDIQSSSEGTTIKLTFLF